MLTARTKRDTVMGATHYGNQGNTGKLRKGGYSLKLEYRNFIFQRLLEEFPRN